MLTEIQIANLHKLDSETQITILHECAEALGLVSIDDYCEIMAMKKRNVYYQVKSGKIKAFNIGKHIFPLINIKK